MTVKLFNRSRIAFELFEGVSSLRVDMAEDHGRSRECFIMTFQDKHIEAIPTQRYKFISVT